MTASASASGGAAPFGGGSAAPAGSAGSNTSQAAAVAAAAAAAAQLGNRLVVAFGETAKNVPVHGTSQHHIILNHRRSNSITDQLLTCFSCLARSERKYFGDVFSFDGREWNQVKTDYKKDSYSPNERYASISISLVPFCCLMVYCGVLWCCVVLTTRPSHSEQIAKTYFSLAVDTNTRIWMIVLY